MFTIGLGESPKTSYSQLNYGANSLILRYIKEATGKEAAISIEDIDLFKRSIEPSDRYQKLGVLLAQFPPSFKNDSHGHFILKAVIKTFGPYRLAVELRHRSWRTMKT